MNNATISYILYFLQMSIMFSAIFPFAKSKLAPMTTYLLLVAEGMMTAVIAQTIGINNPFVSIVNYIFSILMIYFLFEGSKVKRIVIALLFYVIIILDDVLIASIGSMIFKISPDQFVIPSEKIKLNLLGIIVLLIEAICIWLIVPKYNKSGTVKLSNKTLFKFMLYPISQFLLLWCVLMQVYFTNLNVVAIFLFVSVVLSLLTDLYMFNNMIEIEKKNIAEQRVKSLEYMTYIQNNEYNHMMEANENIRKLKHDYNNFLNSSVLLLEQDDVNAQKEGLQLIKQLQNRVSTGYKSFCKHHVVNAVLNEKYSTCNEQDIQFACTVNIPNDINIDSIQLCSIFSNSLDNSIRAVNKLPIEKRMIELDAKVDNNFLIIKVVNPYIKEVLEDRPHLGLSIIKEIATSYDGEMIVTEREEEFSLMVCLNLVGEKL